MQQPDEILLSKVKKEGIENNFSDSRYFLRAIETYGLYHSSHKINELEILFIHNRITIKFSKKKCLLGFRVYSFITSNPFGTCKELEIFLNDKKIGHQFMDACHNIKLCISQIDYLKEDNTIKIDYPNSSEGRAAYKFHSQNIIFEVTPYRDDNYYFDIEYRRVLKNSDNV